MLFHLLLWLPTSAWITLQQRLSNRRRWQGRHLVYPNHDRVTLKPHRQELRHRQRIAICRSPALLPPNFLPCIRIGLNSHLSKMKVVVAVNPVRLPPISQTLLNVEFTENIAAVIVEL